MQSPSSSAPPSTKEFRSVVDQTFCSYHIKPANSRTRKMVKIDPRIKVDIWLTFRRRLRLVTYVLDCETPTDDCKKAIDDIKFWFALLDQTKYIKIETYQHKKEKYIISCWCLIKPL